MSMVKFEDILGCFNDEEMLCANCMEDQNLKEEDIITEDWAEKQDAAIFCDKCKERIY